MFLPFSIIWGFFLTILPCTCTCYMLPLSIETSNVVNLNSRTSSSVINPPNNNMGNDTSNTISKQKKQKFEEAKLMKKRLGSEEAEFGEKRQRNNVELCPNGKHYCRHPFNYPYKYSDNFN